MTIAHKRRSASSRRSLRRSKSRSFRSFIEPLENRRVLAMTYTVNTTFDDADYIDDDLLTLREALMLTNGDIGVADLTPEELLLTAPSDPADLTDTIKFNFRFNDNNHLYYQDDGIAGKLTGLKTPTDSIDDGDINDIDPDWQHSWYSIQLVDALPPVIISITLDGYSALLAHQNTKPVGEGLDTVLRVELDCNNEINPLTLAAADGNETVVRGLVINNARAGIQRGKVLLADQSNVRLEGNFIGTDVSGTHITNRTSNGIQTLSTPPMPPAPPPAGGLHIIGGTTPEARNLISGNQYAYLSNDTTVDFTAQIEGNLIGTDINGNKLVDDTDVEIVGNERGFYIIRTAATYVVGGPTTDSANVISNNTVGALVDTTAAATIRNNLIGTDPTGQLDVGNAAVGILLRSGSNFIQENVVAFNGASPPTGTPSGYTKAAGVRVYVLPGAPSQLNVFSQNSIFLNYGPGIDLGDDGTTANDVGDADNGPNSLQNFPMLDVATADAAGTTITGTLNSLANTTFRIEFFSTPNSPVPTQTSGRVYLGFVDVTTDGNGDANILFTTPTIVTDNDFMTATATRLDAMMAQAETSEFSAAIQTNPPTFSIDDVVVTEGNSGATQATFTVTMSHAQVLPVTVIVNTADGTATLADNDYQQVNGLVLTFDPGDPLSQTVTVTINGDGIVEPNETFFVQLTSPTNATILDGEGMGTITNDDSPGVSIDDVTVTESVTGTVDAVFTVSLDQAPLVPLSVTVNTADGSATLANNDYEQVSSLVLTFNPGDPLTQTVTVKVVGGTAFEFEEEYFVRLSDPVDATIVDDEGVGTIINRSVPAIRVNDVVVIEGNDGTRNAVYTISLSTATTLPVSVVVNTADGTAKASNNDYEAITNLVINFVPGGTRTKTFTVLINGDKSVEPNENYFVNLSGETNSSIADGQGEGTITNDDVAVTPAKAAKDLLVLGSDASTADDRFTRVKIIDLKTGDVRKTFAPYGNSFRGGVRVAVADLTNDGIAEIITAPGAGRDGLIKVFNLSGVEQEKFRIRPYPDSFIGGVFVAAGDVNGDGWIDVITSPGSGRASEIKVWKNRVGVSSAEGDPIGNDPIESFLAFGSSFRGGATVAAGDLNGDGKAEIVVGNGEGMSPTVRVFDATKFGTTSGVPVRLREIKPFEASDRGGVFVAVGNIRENSTPEIIIGNGKNGRGRVELYNADGSRFKSFSAYTDDSKNAPVYVAAKEIDHDDALLEVVTGQGNGGRRRRSWQPNGDMIDNILENDNNFRDGFFVA
jgi:hypothetical protein